MCVPLVGFLLYLYFVLLAYLWNMKYEEYVGILVLNASLQGSYSQTCCKRKAKGSGQTVCLEQLEEVNYKGKYSDWKMSVLA